ncbi:hypothetical protein SVAN01_00364 [Stagonosporopsis vannaccii]|nr:hypothetical protein SVAN01_00364 [Stagonosporopsis vannaccii]
METAGCGCCRQGCTSSCGPAKSAPCRHGENGTSSPAAECQQILEAEGRPHFCAEIPYSGMQGVRNSNSYIWNCEQTIAVPSLTLRRDDNSIKSQDVEVGREIGHRSVTINRRKRHAAGSPNPALRKGQGPG